MLQQSDEFKINSVIELVWLDSATKNQQYQEEMKKLFQTCHFLETINDYLMLPNQSEKKYFVIVSGSLGKDFMKEAGHLNNILNVLIYCGNVQFHSTWAKDYGKIKGVENDFERIKGLLIKLSREFQSELSWDESIIQQVLIEFMINLTSKEAQKKGLEDFKRFAEKYINEQYSNDYQLQNQMKLLQKILEVLKDEVPTGTKIITWYINESFMYRMINNTIRSKCFSDIFQIRYLVYILFKQLQNCRQEDNYPNKLYRGTMMALNEFEECRISQKFFLFSGFTSLCLSRMTAVQFLAQTEFSIANDMRNNFVKVLFEIEPTLNDAPIPVAVKMYSSFHQEEEYVTQLNTFLQIKSFNQDQNGLWVIKAKICSIKDINIEIAKSKKITDVKKETEQILQLKTQNKMFDIADLLKQINKTKDSLKLMKSWQGATEEEEAQRLQYISKIQ